MRGVWALLAVIFLLASVILLASSRLLPAVDEARWEYAQEAAGQVVGFAQSESGLRPLVSFVAHDGFPYVFEAQGHSGVLRTGQMVSARYFLEPDLRASLKTDFSNATLTLGILGCVFLVAGLIPLFLFLRLASMEKQLRVYGIRVLAAVTGVSTVRHVTFNSRHPYIVTCLIRDQQGIGERPATSGWLWHLPSGLKVGDTLSVLIDPYRPGHFKISEEGANASGSS